MNKIISFGLFLLSLVFNTGISADSNSARTLEADTPTKTYKGHAFVAPKEWSLIKKGTATIMEVPEGGSHIVLVDVEAKDAATAVVKGWAAYRNNDRTLKLATDRSDNNGWSKQKQYEYEISPNEKRFVYAGALFANNSWTVWILDMAHDVREKRSAQVNLIFSSLYPIGFNKESFAGRKAHKLDDKKLAELTDYISSAMEKTGVPGVGLGILQNNQVVFAGGFGIRDFDKQEKVNADTLFMVASNTKAMTTLLLAKLVDDGKITWDTPIVKLMPSFRLGDDKTTSSVLIEHLICACTGLPRKDMDWIFEFKDLTAEKVMEEVARTQPTSDFGEMFQYSNLLAAAAGYVGGHIEYPNLKLGPAYDMAMQTRVFNPLGMQTTTFDFDTAIASNHAEAFGSNIDGETARIDMNANRSVVPVRPAGAAWSNVNDMLKYIAFELSEGVLPNGKQYISKESVLERHKPKVLMSEKSSYGMGLMVDNQYDIKVVHHGGDMFGHHSDMIWLPEYGVGAVVLTSGDPGWIIRTGFQRKLLEVLLDGKKEADLDLASNSSNYFKQISSDRKHVDIPADTAAVRALSSHYKNDALGALDVIRQGDEVKFNFGEWRSNVTTQKNEDGTISFITIDPGMMGFEFVVGSGNKPQLILRDAQHEYVLDGD
jgi:CubicO group peptidase (beta-lactamase class C family)